MVQELVQRYPNDVERFDITSRKKATTLANEPAISELITILLDNAIKHSPAGSPIFIRVFEQYGRVGVEIKSQGTKIPDDKLPKLFDRFFRADTSRTNGEKRGYGLGLSIAKKIADIHHGEITVSSTDEYTTFTLYLPIVRKGSGKSPNQSHHNS